MMGMHCCNCYWNLLDLLPSHVCLWEPCAATSDAQGVRGHSSCISLEWVLSAICASVLPQCASVP